MNSCCWLVEYKELLAFPREPFVHAKVSAGGCGAGYCWAVVVAIKGTKIKLFCFCLGFREITKISEIPGNCGITVLFKDCRSICESIPLNME